MLVIVCNTDFSAECLAALSVEGVKTNDAPGIVNDVSSKTY